MIRMNHEATGNRKAIRNIKATRFRKQTRAEEGTQKIMFSSSSRQRRGLRSYEAYQRGIRFFNAAQGTL